MKIHPYRPMTLAEFRATRRRVADVGAALRDDALEYVPGWLYCGSLWIGELEDGTPWLQLSNLEWTEPLEKLEERLYEFARGEGYGRVPDPWRWARVARAARFDDLDDACRYLQDRYGVDSGDVASLVFSDLEPGDWERFDHFERRYRLDAYLDAELGP